jgi:hypothetical protein
MRRVLLGLAVTALTVLALAGPASASTGPPAEHLGFNDSAASAEWETSSATAITDTVVVVARSGHGPGQSVQLIAEQITENLDANGGVTGFTSIAAISPLDSGSFTLSPPLASASVSASGLFTLACSYDPNMQVIDCTRTTTDVNISWTGQGQIDHIVGHAVFKSPDGFILTTFSNGMNRHATATGTVDGLTLTTADLSSAFLGTGTGGTVFVCIGGRIC